MPRQSRKKSSTDIYHVMLRGINKQDIFEEAEDYVRMKELLTYDNQNRLTTATYGEQSDLTGNSGHYTEQVTSYSPNSAITALKRYGKMQNNNFGLIDDLTMTLNGNQTTQIADAATPVLYSGSFGFRDNTVVTNGTEYGYDDCGAMTWDANKGIAKIDYDLFGMPKRIQFTNGHVTEHVYTSEGEKLKTIHRTAVPNISISLNSTLTLNGSNTLSVDSTDYIGSFVFEQGALNKYLFAGGYFTLSGGTPVYHYYTPDHLGNNRAVIKQDGTIEQVTHYYPFGGIIADLSSGQDVQPYKYNGKELDRLNSLNMYDFGARWYDVAGVPMWTSVDPLCEKYYNVSPYNYCGGNPVMMVDPDGCSTWVKQVGEGLYEVIGGDLKDKDFNIYVYTQDDNGEYTIRGESIGITATPTSFYNSDAKDEEQRWRGYIDTRDNSGIDFLNMITGNDAPNIVKYMYHARENQKYDFKRTNGEDNPIDGIDIYRGMPISTDLQGRTTYASARDIGNMAAGYIAAKNGISWKHARWAFDKYQGSKEGPSTINAELYGYFRLGRSTAIQTIHRILRNRK